MSVPLDQLTRPRAASGDAVERIVAGDDAALRDDFAAAGADGPVILWQPGVADLEPQPLRFLLHHWLKLKGGQALPRRAQIDALEMQPALGYIALLDVLENGADFRYRLFGSLIAAASGFDMTGRRLSALRASAYVVDFYRAGYQAVLRRPEPLATVHAPPTAVSSSVWHRLILPFSDTPGAVDRLLVGAVPIKRKPPREAPMLRRSMGPR